MASQVTVAGNIAYLPLTDAVTALDYGNGLNLSNTFTQDYEIDVLGVYDGATEIIERSHTRTDDINLTNIWDTVNTSYNQAFTYTAANRLQDADGP